MPEERDEDSRAWLSPWVRNVVAGLSAVVVLGLIVADTLDALICACSITIGPLGMALGIAVMVLFLNLRLSDLRGKD